MRVLTWLPRDLREQLTELDPARNAPAPGLPSAAELLSGQNDLTESTTDLSRERRSSRPARRWLAPMFAATAVVAVVVGVVTVVRSGSSHPAAGPPGSSQPSTVGTAPDRLATDAAARKWAGFPEQARPRPVVLVGPQTDGPDTGFQTGDDKLAFLEGHVSWPSSVHEVAPGGSKGSYPLLDARQAFALLPHATGNPPTSAMLTVAAVTLTQHEFSTDRGRQQLPAWAFRLDGVTSPVYVLAVASSARYPARLTDGSGVGGLAALSDGGRSLTIRFTAHQDPAPCGNGFDQVLDVAQTATTVVLAVTVTRSIPATPSTQVCGLPGYVATGPITPGAPGTRTITLDELLGGRVVVDGTGVPYQVSGT